MDEIVFEKYGFQSYCRAPAPSCALYHANKPKQQQQHDRKNNLMSQTYSVVVDVGYSFTSVVPFVDDTPVNFAIKRLNVGGKLLTNYLKEIVSYRAFSMMDETHLVNHIKEKVCTTSLDFKSDLVLSKLPAKKNPLKLEYVLPTHSAGNTLGYIKTPKTKSNEDDQILSLTNERISVPELLFQPGLVSIQQKGVAGAIAESVSACHPDIQALLYNNIIITGGSSKFPNFVQRLKQELRSYVPSQYNLGIRSDPNEDASLIAWKGGSAMVECGAYDNYCLSKAEYQEYGTDACKRKFFFYT
mmetsp:Transcript_27342/g.48346  ORF Transcript_27342/g.48346 Transcript_27342/m.48346 type:complete len:300 (-) Transcript_27342:172-1071(-)